jgi:hypothetical protein
MNIINQFFLYIVMLPGRFYEVWGVNMTQLRAIVSIKLVMDDRRRSGLTTRYRKNNEPVSSATILTMALTGLFGFLLVFLALKSGGDMVMRLTIFFSMFIIMLCITLVNDFTAVLIDVRDNSIILPKPVSDRTLVLARLLHILIHICKMVIPLSTPFFVYLCIWHGIGEGLALIPMVMLATLFSIFLINALYIIILRLTTPERFKNIISSIQIVFAIVIYGLYQYIPRLSAEDLDGFSDRAGNWLALLPSYWFANGHQLFFHAPGHAVQWVAAACSIIVPVFSFYLVIRVLAPTFNQKIGMISGGETAAAPSKGQSSQPKTPGIAGALARVFTNNPVERTGFLFVLKMMGRSRDFKIRVYPSIGYMVILSAMPLYRVLSDTSKSIPPHLPLVWMYMSSLMLINALLQLSFSEKYKAAIMFYIPPVAFPGQIISGGLKAILVMFHTAVGLLFLGLGLWLTGLEHLLDLILAFVNQWLISLAFGYLVAKKLPFSQPMENAQRGGGRSFIVLFLLFASGLLGVLQYFLLTTDLLRLICLICSVAGSWFILHQIKQTTWGQLEASPDF